MSRVLIVGGIRSGKSRYAEAMMPDKGEVVYVATGGVDLNDPEWTERISMHRSRRPGSWKTLETLDVVALLRDANATILVDCVNGWLAGTMGGAGCWEPDGDRAHSRKQLGVAIDELVDAWLATAATVVAVTNEVGMSLVPLTPAGRWFAEELGSLNARLADGADEVWQMTVGIPVRLR